MKVAQWQIEIAEVQYDISVSTAKSEALRDHESVEMCVPLYTILLAIGNPTIDYFSLDIEGAEIGVLNSLPWDKIRIKVIVTFNKKTFQL